MAALCPSCEHIHFPPPGADPPRECARCGVDMLAPRPSRPVAGDPPPPAVTSGPHLPTVLAGIAAAFVGVCLALVGKQKLDQFETATVTVRVAKLVDREYVAGLAKYTHYKFETKATYLADGKAYPYKLEASATRWDWADGETFPIYYHVEDPATPLQSRPFALLFCGAFTVLAGLGLIGFAVVAASGSELPAAYRPLRRA